LVEKEKKMVVSPCPSPDFESSQEIKKLCNSKPLSFLLLAFPRTLHGKIFISKT
jgi:hypothetical protein